MSHVIKLFALALIPCEKVTTRSTTFLTIWWSLQHTYQYYIPTQYLHIYHYGTYYTHKYVYVCTYVENLRVI